MQIVSMEIGVVFQQKFLDPVWISGLNVGSYKWSAVRTMLRSLQPLQLAHCTILHGDIGSSPTIGLMYCLAVRSDDPLVIDYVRHAMESCSDRSLAPLESRFVRPADHQLVPALSVDPAGELEILDRSSFGNWVVAGTGWVVAGSEPDICARGHQMPAGTIVCPICKSGPEVLHAVKKVRSRRQGRGWIEAGVVWAVVAVTGLIIGGSRGSDAIAEGVLVASMCFGVAAFFRFRGRSRR